MPQDLTAIYTEVRALFEPYTSLYRIERDTPEGISLTSFEGVEMAFAGKMRSYPTMFFASATIRKNSVVFYYMPIYCWPELKEQLGPDLLKTLKGHTCFHLKKLTPELMEQIRAALKLGHETYVQKGWVSA